MTINVAFKFLKIKVQENRKRVLLARIAGEEKLFV